MLRVCNANIVAEVTDDKNLERAARKQLQVDNAAKKSRDAKLLKLADKTSNLCSVALSPAAGWDDRRRSEYVEWASRVEAGVRGISDWLDQQFEEAKAQALESIPKETALHGN